MQPDGFIREVEEELQRERMARLWKRYGPIIVGVALLVVAATAGKVGWDAWQARKLEQQGSAFATAEAMLVRGEPASAAAAFAALADSAGGDTAALAGLRQAAALFAAGDESEALAVLDRLAGRSGLDPVLADLAAVAAAQRRLGQVDPGELQAALRPRMAADAPYRHSARELFALAALEAGDRAQAIETLQELERDATAPETLKRRARELLAALGVEEPAAEAGAGDEAS